MPTTRAFKELFDLLVSEYGEEACGADLIVAFWSHQFRRVRPMKISSANKGNSTISKKGLMSFGDRTETDIWADLKLATKFGIYAQDFYDPIVRNDLVLIPHEEEEKSRYFGEESGYLRCLDATTLINPYSPHCRACKFATTCKERLKKDFPIIHYNRFEKNAVKEDRVLEEVEYRSKVITGLPDKTEEEDLEQFLKEASGKRKVLPRNGINPNWSMRFLRLMSEPNK